MNIEYNNIVYDNTATPNQGVYSNTATSDELAVPVPNNDEILTSYAAGKRAKKVSSIVFGVMTITIAGGLGGVAISNAFLPSPTLSNVSFVAENNEVVYSFSISNLSSYYAIVEASEFVSGDVFYTREFQGDGLKEDSFSFEGKDKIAIAISITNKFDYLRSLYETTLTKEA